MHQIIVDCLGHTDKADVAVCPGRIAGKLAYRIHGIIAADVKHIADISFLKSIKKLGIYRISQVFRQLIAAGAQVCSGRSL